MPEINGKATRQNTYDAIVVGSGISGSFAAKELCEKGLKVLLLERGKELVHPHYPTASNNIWDFPHRGKLTTEDKETRYVQCRHYSYGEDNKEYYINDKENPYIEAKRYDWIRADIVGGRSILWARQCYRWSDIDFEANIKDGYGVDWPIRYKDIAPWYDYVESFVGISGSREGIATIPDGNFLPPFEMNCVEKDFKQKLEARFKNRKLIIGRTANLTVSNKKGRGQCQARNLCHRGCPYGAYYSSNSGALPAALATNNLSIRPHALVNRVIYDEDKQRATGVEIIDTQTRQTEVFYARIIFLNAATLATTFILLNSVSSRFSNGLGNGSGQVGKNLMDHHKGVSVTADVDGFLDSYYYGRRPTGVYIPRFRNIDSRLPDFLRGYHFGGSAVRVTNGDDVPIGADLKTSMTEPGSWKMSIYAFGETLPYNDNTAILDHSKKDDWGRPLLSVDCAFKENELKMVEDIKVTGQEMLEAAGYKNIKVSGAISFPGNANHEMGTARMGRDPKTSVLNAFNQMHEVPNVFITDGSCMTSGSCVNPSITYMALTARACDYAVAQLKKQHI
ncbi:MAG: GMC family oxidoreductase [Chitinophagaceae bacterium]|nr:GMC family oxidoreductase [Chitinophagaceae bacterium]